MFGDEVLAAAILDRLLHHSFTLKVQGESYRLKQKRKMGLLGRAEKSTDRARGGARDLDHAQWTPRCDPAVVGVRDGATNRAVCG